MDAPAAVLVVDDDRMILHTLQEQLAREPYRVVTVSKVQQGLDAVVSGEFAIILADQTMPDMSGIEFLRRCRDLQPHSSRMLITGMATSPVWQEAVLRGDIFRYLLKPWSRSDLLLSLHQGLERYQLLRQVDVLTEELKREKARTVAVAGRVQEGGDGPAALREAYPSKTSRTAAGGEAAEIPEGLSQVLSHLDEAIWLSDAETNELLYFSPVHERIWNRSAAELCGEASWLDSIHPDDRERVRQAALGDAGPNGYDQEYRILWPDGQVRWVRDRAFPLIEPDGTVTRLAGMAEDITDRKAANEQLELRVRERTEELAWANLALESEVSERRRAEVQLRESNQRLQQALKELHDTQQQVIQQERLRALGRMASGVAHDFNNALIPILGYTELLLERPELLDDRDKLGQYLRLIRTAAKDASSVVGRLREFYRPRDDAEIFESVDLAHAVGEAISLTQPRWRDEALAQGRFLDVQTDLRPVPAASCNGAEIREMVTNLVFNAVDACPTGGSIWVRTYPEDDRAVLEVQDNGVGMTDEVKARCMEPFVTTKGERGTGLGLATVYGIVQRHHGSIEIESAVGKGSLFRIRLPFHDAPALGGDVSPRPLQRRLSVLVIDDEEVARDVVSLFLRNDDHQVTVASSASEGLRLLHENTFDLVITDHAMPGMTGEAFTASARGAGVTTPILMLTGFGELMNAAGKVPAGVTKVVNKPVTIDALRAAVAEVVGP
ncbi:MAG: response regulator [Verrucomicrobia bacterium]|nr:response regulator [Verrucomicrobiota bacterium]